MMRRRRIPTIAVHNNLIIPQIAPSRRAQSIVAIAIIPLGAAFLLLQFGDSMRWLSVAGLLVPLFISGIEGAIDLDWHPPDQTLINNITAVISGPGVYGFIYNSSDSPRYGTYNWCNMPHVRRDEYVPAPSEYELVYVELIHRHHKRTPYASNSFPVEPYRWDCDDEAVFSYASPLLQEEQQQQQQRSAVPIYWNFQASSSQNPFSPGTGGWTGSCQFPQITSGGLDDSFQHGVDLYGVYHSLLGLLPSHSDPPESWRQKTSFRVTTNTITSQVAGMLLGGLVGPAVPKISVTVQPAAIDSLEPRYPCPRAAALMSIAKSSAAWKAHLRAAQPLFDTLDAISGVNPSDVSFHESVDHYYDNLSARQCHAKPLPCHPNAVSERGNCVNQDMADAVYRLGHWEYSYMYRDAGPEALAAAVAGYGVWVAELASHLRDVVAHDTKPDTVWRHNIAHDGSLSRLLAVLQVDEMVWPGMGAEVVFELFRKKEKGDGSGYFVRVLFGGRVLTSSSPALGRMNLLLVETLLGYFDGLVGVDAGLVKGKCAS
ncbi:histidine phosphatase superfamily [Podospora didyma]|uniref:Histidine phosphatase superfamily n=1 Tax=Podospora didyma TaxID=330526 RepID=A0AAE0NT75_9PEZI|nr:histidine phosphatase superfamily [Podospora didyma]